MAFNLEYLYYLTRKKTNNIDFHKHNCYEVVFYLKGSGKTTINNTTYEYSENSFAIIHPGVLHDELHNNDTVVLYLGFSSNENSIIVDEGLYIDSNEGIILAILKKIKEEFIHKPYMYNLKLDLLVQEMIIEILRLLKTKSITYDEFNYIKRYITENYSQKIDLDMLAHISGYSYHRFRHVFKEKTGFSPINYLMNKRIENAKQLLSETDDSIASIAQHCGFSSHSQFSLIFKRDVGQTPQVFRNNIKLPDYA